MSVKLNISPAVTSRSKFDLSCSHLTTLNFGQVSCLWTSEAVPGDKFSIDYSIFSRLAPLVLPTYGKASLKTAAFFVPYHQIAEDSEAWLAGKTVFNGSTPVLRFITMSDLYELFKSKSQTGSATNYDWLIVNAAGTKVYYKLTIEGRFIYRIMRSLGYQIPDMVNLDTTSSWNTTLKNQHLNIMPLLSFFKAYNDYMSLSSKTASSQLTYVLLNIRQNKSYTVSTYGYSTDGHLSYGLLGWMFGQLKVAYDSDMLTTAWQSPNTPLDSLSNVPSVSYPGGYTNVEYTIQADRSNTYLPGSSITQRALDFLSRFDAWVRRNNYSGSRDVQQIYSRFGVKSDEYRTHLAYKIGEASFPIQVGDVTATAQTDDTLLGQYAGKGIVSGDNKFNVECSDFGQIVVIGWINVHPVYPDGFDYSVLRNSPLDFFNPEFDGVGVRAMSIAEVAQDSKKEYPQDYSSEKVFGFTERYNEYKFAKDRITGDMCLYDDMKAWHFGRDLSDLRAQGGLYAQSNSLCTQDPVRGTEYDRIFSIEDNNEDKFYLTCQFNVHAVRPMKNLSEVTNLGTGNLHVQKNGDQVS